MSRHRGLPRKRLVCRLALALVVATIASGQTDMSHFEVASVKLNKDPGDFAPSCTGGPGTQSPTLWICKRINTLNLLYSAFALYLYQFSAPPQWMRGSYWSVSARLPAGATRDQFREMQRNLVIERFGLIWRWRESDATVYRLVPDPGGVKLRESGPDAAPAVVAWGFPLGRRSAKIGILCCPKECLVWSGWAITTGGGHPT